MGTRGPLGWGGRNSASTGIAIHVIGVAFGLGQAVIGLAVFADFGVFVQLMVTAQVADRKDIFRAVPANPRTISAPPALLRRRGASYARSAAIGRLAKEQAMNEQVRLIARLVAIETSMTEGAELDAAFVATSTLHRTGPLREVDSADNGDSIP